MKRLILSFAMLAPTGCTALAPAFPAEEVKVDGDRHTLAFYTGEVGHNWYDPSYEVAAKRACGERSYKVLERSAAPSTLETTPGLKGVNRFFWVVQCG